MDMAERSAPAGQWSRTPSYGIVKQATPYVLRRWKRPLRLGNDQLDSACWRAPHLWVAERMLGTNPLPLASPAKEEPPHRIDIATSAAAYGIERARSVARPIPEGWGSTSKARHD